MTSYEAQNHIDDYYQLDQIQNEPEEIQTSRSYHEANNMKQLQFSDENHETNNSTTGFMKYKTEEPQPQSKAITIQRDVQTRAGAQTNRSDAITRNQNYQDMNPNGKNLSLEYGKTIRLLRNGDEFYRGHKFVINSRKYKYFDVFMDDISNDLNANFGAIRKIHTPINGHRIKNLEELEDGKTYVAAGNSRFIKINYTDVLEGRRPAPNNRLPSLPADYTSVVIRQYDTPQNALINVYRNGDPNHPPAKILLYKSTLNSYDAVLDQISTRVKLANGAVFKLFTMEGELVKNSSDIMSGESYVAAHKERFKKVDYFSGNANGSPRYIRKTEDDDKKSIKTGVIAPRKAWLPVNSQPSYASTTSQKTDISVGNKYNGWRKENTVPSNMPNNNLPPVVNAPRVRVEAKARVTVNVDKDDSGLFKAKSQVKEKEIPKTIEDDPTMFVDMPVDRKRAEQVEDEFLNEKKVRMNDIKNTEVKPNFKPPPAPKFETPQPKERSPSPVKRIPTPPAPIKVRSPSPEPLAQNRASPDFFPQPDTSRDDEALKLNVVSDRIESPENDNQKSKRIGMDIMEKDLKKISVNNFNELSRSETNNMEKKVRLEDEKWRINRDKSIIREIIQLDEMTFIKEHKDNSVDFTLNRDNTITLDKNYLKCNRTIEEDQNSYFLVPKYNDSDEDDEEKITSRTGKNEINSARLSTARNEIVDEHNEVASSLVQNEDIFKDEIVQNEEVNDANHEIATNQIVTVNELDELIKRSMIDDQSEVQHYDTDDVIKPSISINKEQEEPNNFQVEQMHEQEVKAEIKNE